MHTKYDKGGNQIQDVMNTCIKSVKKRIWKEGPNRNWRVAKGRLWGVNKNQVR